MLNHLSMVGDGVEAMASLRREGKYVHTSRPDLILLDLNLPREDGREVLTEIKVDGQLKPIPVVMLITSSAVQDFLDTYEHHANFYVKRSVDLEQFSAVVKSLEAYSNSLGVKYPATNQWASYCTHYLRIDPTDF